MNEISPIFNWALQATLGGLAVAFTIIFNIINSLSRVQAEVTTDLTSRALSGSRKNSGCELVCGVTAQILLEQLQHLNAAVTLFPELLTHVRVQKAWVLSGFFVAGVLVAVTFVLDGMIAANYLSKDVRHIGELLCYAALLFALVSVGRAVSLVAYHDTWELIRHVFKPYQYI